MPHAIRRDIVLSALAACDYPQAVPPILEALRSPEGATELAGDLALRTLASRGHETAIAPLIRELRREKDLETRAAMAGALSRLTGESLGNDSYAWDQWWRAGRS